MKRCNECSKQYSQMNKNPEGGCTPPVIQINNDPGCVLFHKVVFPASIGDDTTNPPSEFIGKYKNVLLVYEANNRSYMFSSDGMYTKLNNGVTDYEEATNLPQINGNTLIGDKTGTELGLQNELTAGANIQIDSNNVISATDTTYGPATDESIGLVKPGDGLSVQADGTLDIADIEEHAHFFDTVAEMKAAVNLTNGSYARTLGYHSKNDDGGALYSITNSGAADEGKVIAIGDSLYAHLIFEDYVTPEMFGAYGDGTHDDQDAINAALNSGSKKVLFMPKTYMVKGYEEGQPEGSVVALYSTTGLVVKSNQEIDLNGATVKCITNSRQNYNIFTIAAVHDVTLGNGFIVGDRNTHTGSQGQWGYGVAIKYSSNITLKNLTISECWGDGINLNNNGDTSTLSQNIVISKCICDANRRQGMSVENGNNIIVEKSIFKNTGNNSFYTNPSYGVDVEPGYTGNKVLNLVFRDCEFSGNKGCGLGFLADRLGDVVGVKVINCLVKNNLMTPSNSAFSVIGVKDVEVIDNYFDNGADARPIMVIAPGNDILIQGNTIKNARMFLRSTFLNDGKIILKNNHISTTLDGQWNGIVEAVAADTENGNNKLIVDGNIFESAPTNNFTGYIVCPITSKFVKVIANNNIFKFGNRGISTNASCIISNNNFVALYGSPILLDSGNSNQVSAIDSNVFEEPAWNTNIAGIVMNTNNNNIALQNNICFKNCMNAADQQTRNYAPNRWLQNLTPTGASLDENNNILDNQIV